MAEIKIKAVVTDAQKSILEELLKKIQTTALEAGDNEKTCIFLTKFCTDICSWLTLLQSKPTADPSNFRWDSDKLLPECWKILTDKSQYKSEPLFLLHNLLLMLNEDLAKVIDTPFLTDKQLHPLMVGAQPFENDQITDLLKRISTAYEKLDSHNDKVVIDIGKKTDGFQEFIPLKSTSEDMEAWRGALAFSVDGGTVLLMVPWTKIESQEVFREFGVQINGEVSPDAVVSILTTIVKALE